MLKKVFNSFKNLDKLTKLIMSHGLKFCFMICLVSLAILLTYNFTFTIPILFTIGFILFRLSLIFGIEFVICGFVVDGIKKQIIQKNSGIRSYISVIPFSIYLIQLKTFHLTFLDLLFLLFPSLLDQPKILMLCLFLLYNPQLIVDLLLIF